MKFFPILYSPPLGMETKTNLMNPRTKPIMRLNSTGDEVKCVQGNTTNTTGLKNFVQEGGVFQNLAKQHCIGKPLYCSPKNIGFSPYLKQTKTTNKRLNMGEYVSMYRPSPKYPKLSSPIVDHTVKNTSDDLAQETDVMTEIMTKCSISSEKDLVKISGSPPESKRPTQLQVQNHTNNKGLNGHSVVISCNSLFSSPTTSVTSVTQVKQSDKCKQVCDIETNCQNQCDDSSSSLVVHISAECKGKTKVHVNITKKDNLENSTPSTLRQHPKEDHKEHCSGSSKKKRKPRPSCKKRRRLNLQKEPTFHDHNECSSKSSNCAFCFVVGWTSPKKSEKLCKEQSSNKKSVSAENSNKFSFFISGADLSDFSSSDDGFSESEDNFDSKSDEDMWNSFVNTNDPFSPFNFQCVFQIGHNSNNENQSDTRDPVVQTKLRTANETWEKCYQGGTTSKRESIVSFAPIDQLETVEHIEQYCSEYAEARLGPWEQYARDRQRFQKRIQEVESAIGYCFSASHRDSVYKRMQAATT